MGGDEQAFKDMKACYDAIQESRLVVDSKDTSKTEVLQTVEGIPLSDLGLGLGPNTNGKDCEQCAGRGYRSWEDEQRRPHWSCYGVGCSACRYRGWFVGERKLKYRKCEACNGKGEIKIYNPVILKGAMTQAQRKRKV